MATKTIEFVGHRTANPAHVSSAVLLLWCLSASAVLAEEVRLRIGSVERIDGATPPGSLKLLSAGEGDREIGTGEPLYQGDLLAARDVLVVYKECGRRMNWDARGAELQHEMPACPPPEETPGDGDAIGAVLAEIPGFSFEDYLTSSGQDGGAGGHTWGQHPGGGFDYLREGGEFSLDDYLLGQNRTDWSMNPGQTWTDLLRQFDRGNNDGNEPATEPSFAWPAKGTVISRFGDYLNEGRNWGIDLGALDGDAVAAAADGVVLFVSEAPVERYGSTVIVGHAGGWSSAYGFNSSVSVTVGDAVSQGQRIAVARHPDESDAPQLHFELRRGLTAIDPLPKLPGR
jgi:hypothetical protein